MKVVGDKSKREMKRATCPKINRTSHGFVCGLRQVPATTGLAVLAGASARVVPAKLSRARYKVFSVKYSHTLKPARLSRQRRDQHMATFFFSLSWSFCILELC